MLEALILITFLIVFYFMFQKDRKDRERVDIILQTFESTVNKVLDSVEKTNTKFYEMLTEIEKSHFEKLEKTSDKTLDTMQIQMESFIRVLDKKEPVKVEPFVGSLDSSIENSIEKEDTEEIPLDQLEQIPINDGMKLQFEGEERIYPVNIG